jgi:diguanylate cyclase (GGDEF)-like protein/PAS domain S-box-containing protein
MWDGQLLLRAVVEMKKEGRVIGKVMTESSLPVTIGALKHASRLGETEEQALCAPFGLNMQCFPTTLNPKIFTASKRSATGVPLPMTHALEGETGFITTRDYRDQEVVAAYSPVGDLGLGMVLKMDSAELYAPVWNQLRYLIPLMAGVLVIALLLLRWKLTPLVRRLIRAEAETAQRTAELEEKNKQLQDSRRMLEEKVVQLGLTSNYNRSILESGQDCLKVLSLEGRLLEMAAPGRKIMCVKDFEKIRNTDWLTFWQRADDREAAQRALATASAGEIGSFQGFSPTMDGTPKWWDVVVSPILDIDGKVDQLLAASRDITEKKKSEELIWQQANFDSLTGLPNRRMFHDRLGQEIKKSHRSGLPMALLLLDLDHFKDVNDNMGHAQGDVLLVEAARRIAECVRETDTVARLGGDEFTVILSELEDVNSVERIAQKIIERLAAPFQLQQETVFVSASIGIALYPDDAQETDALIKNADQAMYVAKDSGRNCFRYFTAALQEAAQTRLRLANDLRSALVNQQFRVFYQPIETLANGAIHKAEALLRWQHPTRGFISPAEFIPVAEETGMIIDIGDWVFREVASQAVHWRASHYAKFQISVNVSPVQFRDNGSNFKAWLDYIQELGLPGQSIVMEITEGLLLDAHTSVTDQLLAFRDAGIRVSLDDFGTGYSSLSYLKKFDIDYLKIDQSFVRNLAEDPNDQTLCEAIIVMAHKLGLKVIAEGVETEQQRDLLAVYGCDYVQGWLYSKAVPADEFESLLKAQAK